MQKRKWFLLIFYLKDKQLLTIQAKMEMTASNIKPGLFQVTRTVICSDSFPDSEGYSEKSELHSSLLYFLKKQQSGASICILSSVLKSDFHHVPFLNLSLSTCSIITHLSKQLHIWLYLLACILHHKTIFQREGMKNL